MDKNISAFLDTEAFTIAVRYQHSDSSDAYTYVTNDASIKVGDWVAVPTKNRDYTNGPVTKRTPVMRPVQGKMMSIDDVINCEANTTFIMEDRISVAQVVSIDDGVDIEPDSSIEFKWVIQKLNLTPYFQLLDRNKQLQATVADAYKRNLRKSFAERILGELDDGPRLKLSNLLKPSTAKGTPNES
jgi:hypothetical protein